MHCEKRLIYIGVEDLGVLGIFGVTGVIAVWVPGKVAL